MFSNPDHVLNVLQEFCESFTGLLRVIVKKLHKDAGIESYRCSALKYEYVCQE
ncbi:hypothetical protein [Methanosarcina sp. MSH10X1]|uniref:hypothetical protein n=1 Tax=Methanosarcina sp. MSH10X1 TaxID=2507075 RepID=UPI0013E2F9F8|nr:hypothetical protein [Methanosarcina sp. MSH10X1]